MNKAVIFFFLLLHGYTIQANDIITKFTTKIANEQDRIDLIDGNKDGSVSLASDLQSEQATATYITLIDQVELNILNNVLSSSIQKVDQLRKLDELLVSTTPRNVHFYTQIQSILQTIIKVQRAESPTKLSAILSSNTLNGLNLIPFFIEKRIAESFLVNAARIEPAEVLKHFKEFAYKPFSSNVTDMVCYHAPMKIKTYLHSYNDVHKAVRNSADLVTQSVYKIYKEKGTVSKAFILLDDIHKGLITIPEAHNVAKYDSTLFDYLIKKRKQPSIMASHSVDDALKYLSLKRVRIINDLHEESDAIRFKTLTKYDASEIYTLIVYSQDEIYTSTFLGMYKRLMPKVKAENSFAFLEENSFNKFRTFISMCAGFNTLQDFLSRMGLYDQQRLFTKLAEKLEYTNDNMASAVAVADTYGSIKKQETKNLLAKAITTYYSNISPLNIDARNLYQLLLSVLEISEAGSAGSSLNQQVLQMKLVPFERLFKNGKNVQQHFFFNDMDGRASYNHFIATFRNGNWQIIDKKTYVLIKPRTGSPVELFANKPNTEYAGQDAIRSHFEATKHWPDLVVHRGHSYYVSAAIESLTPNAEVVFLGSCGGYNNISSVLKYSPNAQIIASKQIGTMLVNDKVLLELNETLRKGNSLEWDKIWYRLNSRFATGSIAKERFQDYIPPHKNLGALFIKTYRSML